MIARFNPSGMIDAMNGAGYTADVAMPYGAGVPYHFRVVIDPTSYLYSLYVTAPGSAEVQLANNYAFRSQQATTSSLNNWGTIAEVGSHTVCNMNVSTTPIVPVAPLITSQPAGSTVVAGQSATFSATVSGTAPLSYQWNRNGTAITGATSATYTLAAPTTADSGAQFSVTVKNTAGSITSGSAVLTVSAPAVAPQITTQPASQAVTAGQTASFATSVTGTAPFGYQWMKNGGAISGATSASYTTPGATTADSGAQFSVTVSNTSGSVSSNSASLTVNTPVTAPLITTQPLNQTITAGQTASFSVAASGTGPLSYQWMKNAAATSGGSSSSYTTAASTTTDNGAQFTVVVSNTAGSTTSSAATLSVTAASACQTSSATWTNTTIATQTTAFTASYDGTPGQAGMDGVVGISLGAATGYGSLAVIARFNPSGMIDAMNGAGYTADVAMPYGAGVPYHFRVVIDPTSYLFSLYVTAPGSAEVRLANNYAFRSQQATTSSLNNWGMVAEVGSHTVCNMSVSTTPIVPVAPLITSQPAGSTTVAGQSATFSAVVSGTAPLSYQWNLNGAAITGATSATYTLAAPTTADSGAQFSVTVKNTAGSITSGSAVLTVSAMSVSLTANASGLNFGTVAMGSNGTLPVTLTNSGNSNVTISNVSVSGAGFNASGLSAGQAIAAGQSATLNVTLTPSSTGSATGSMTVASNAANSPAIVALTGTGGPQRYNIR